MRRLRGRVETCGGGGYGPAWESAPELVRKDMLKEKISPERARDVYGVAINAGATGAGGRIMSGPFRLGGMSEVNVVGAS